MRVAINGFGRIGRSVFRILENVPGVEVVAINDLFDHEVLRYLLDYDTVMGPFGKALKLDGDEFVTAKGRVRLLSERDPSTLPWGEMGIDAVVESTGVFRKRAQLEQHLTAGAGRVVLTVPAADAIDYTVVLGVNDDGLTHDHRIISNASCTTNCLAPMASVLDRAFGIEEGVINTVHAYTNDQRLADVPHSDWRRSRAAAENIIPNRCRQGGGRGSAAVAGQVTWYRCAGAGVGRLGGGPVRQAVAERHRGRSARRGAGGGRLDRAQSCNSATGLSCRRISSATPTHRFTTPVLRRWSMNVICGC